MNDLLANPAVQAGVAAFVAALVVAFLLQRARLANGEHCTEPEKSHAYQPR